MQRSWGHCSGGRVWFLHTRSELPKTTTQGSSILQEALFLTISFNFSFAENILSMANKVISKQWGIFVPKLIHKNVFWKIFIILPFFYSKAQYSYWSLSYLTSISNLNILLQFCYRNKLKLIENELLVSVSATTNSVLKITKKWAYFRTTVTRRLPNSGSSFVYLGAH